MYYRYKHYHSRQNIGLFYTIPCEQPSQVKGHQYWRSVPNNKLYVLISQCREACITFPITAQLLVAFPDNAQREL